MSPRPHIQPGLSAAQDARDADPEALRVASARVRARAAAAGLETAMGWVLRFPAPADPGAPMRILADGLAGRPGALLRLERDASGAACPTLLWMDDGSPMARALGGTPARDAAWSTRPEERIAAAARLCDGVAMRLGLARGAVRVAAPAAILPLRRRAGRDGAGWSAESPVGPLPSPSGSAAEAAALAARLAERGLPALVVAVEDDVLVAALPPCARFDDFRELVFALDETAAAQGASVFLDGAPAPLDPQLRVARVRLGDDALLLTLAPNPAGWSAAPVDPMAGFWRAAVAEAGPMRSAALTVADPAGKPPRLAARPEAIARVIASWLARPGLATLFGQSGLRSLLALGPAQAAALDLALAAASVSGAGTPSARARALSAALEGADLRLEAMLSGGVLVWDDLAPPFDPEAATFVETVALALLAHGARERSVARAPAWLGAPADRWLLPSALWPDAAAGLAERAPEAPALSGWLRRAFDTRFTSLGSVEAPGLRLSARLAVQPERGALRIEALLEGPLADCSGLWIDGRAAPLHAGPRSGSRLCGVVWRANGGQDFAGRPPEPERPPGFAVGPDAGGTVLLAARLDPVGDGYRLIAAPAGGPCGRWSPNPDPRQPMTLDLRAPPGP